MKRVLASFDIGRLRRALRRAADRIGPVGLIGIALLATCVGYAAGSIQPMREQLDAVRSADVATAVRDTRDRARSLRAGSSDELSRFAAGFPDERELSQLLAAVYAIGDREGLRLAQGEYRFVEPDALGMVQYRVTLPVVGTYPTIRRFIGATLAQIPSIAVTQINLQRERVGLGRIEARIELTLHLRAGGAALAGEPPATAGLSPTTGATR